MEWLKSWFGGTSAERKTRQAVARRAAPLPALVMRTDATMPIVDWEAMDAHAPKTDKPEELDAFWTALARAWLEALGKALDKSFNVTESDHFLLLSPLEPRPAKGVLDFIENTRKRVLLVLNGIARETEMGKVCVLILNDHDRYYQYVSNYYPQEGGEFSLSGGMFIQRGYGHFVFVADDMFMMEPTIAHELTHCLLQHLPIPCWLNEGMAVNTERRLHPLPGRPLYTPEEMHEKHLAFWNAKTIQEFWSGKSWLRQDDGNMLSYDLATHFVSMAAQDFDAFRKFANAAKWEDAGDSAAREHLGYPIAHLFEAVVGEGSWQPDPDAWKEGVEKGQF